MALFNFSDKYTSRVDLAQLLLDKGLTGEIVEIGVWRGDFSEPFFLKHGSRRLHLVDPWRKLTDYDDIRNTDYDPADYAFVLERFKPYGDRVIFHRATSVEAARRLPNDLDFVYIDANHAREHVARDLRLWWQKVRKGGVLAGHDLFSIEHVGVTDAVVEFAQEKGLTIECVRGDYNEHQRLVTFHSYYFEKA